MKQFYIFLESQGWRIEKDFEGEDCAIFENPMFQYTIFIESQDKDLKDAFQRVAKYISRVGKDEVIDGYIEDNEHLGARERGFSWSSIIKAVEEGLTQIVSIGQLLIANAI